MLLKVHRVSPIGTRPKNKLVTRRSVIAEYGSMAARTASDERPDFRLEIPALPNFDRFSRLHQVQSPYSYGLLTAWCQARCLEYRFRSAIITGAANDQHCFCR